MPGNFGAVTPTDIIRSNQTAIQGALQSLRSRVSGQTPWTYGNEGISDEQRKAGTQAGLLRSGGAGIGQLLGFSADSQGARAGSYVGAGDSGGVLSGLQDATKGFMDAPTYQAPPAAAEPGAAAAPPRARAERPNPADLPELPRGVRRGRAAGGGVGRADPLETGRGGGFYGAP